jgi:hypothetical protein
MGIAAYNRGTRAIRIQIDRELEDKRIRIVHPKEIDHGKCELCGGRIGVQPIHSRGDIWSIRLKNWLSACSSCRQAIQYQNNA